MKRRGLLIAAGLLAGLAVLLAGIYLAMDREKKELTPETRSGLPGQFIVLPGGTTHYQWAGPPDGPVVVLIHGFSVPAYVWEHTAPALAAAGFRVLTFDLFGRGTSDRPKTAYTLDFFVRQVDDLLNALKIDRPVDIGGLSMGGFIAAAYTNQHTSRVRRVMLFSPQAQVMSSAPGMGMVTLPGLGDYLFATYIAPVYLAGDVSDFADASRAERWKERYLDAMQYTGFRAALLSTLRSMQDDPLVEYRKLGALDRPVLLVWGQADTTVPFENAANLMRAIPQARLVPIPGGRHLACYEFPDQVNPALVDFLKR